MMAVDRGQQTVKMGAVDAVAAAARRRTGLGWSSRRWVQGYRAELGTRQTPPSGGWPGSKVAPLFRYGCQQLQRDGRCLFWLHGSVRRCERGVICRNRVLLL